MGWQENIPRIDLSGSPYEIGLAHGRSLASQIDSQLSIYRGIFQETCKLDWAGVLQVAMHYRDTIAKLTPDLLEEMRGIADGAVEHAGSGGMNKEGNTAVRLLDIVALNCRSEIALGLWEDGCTALAWRLPTSDGRTAEKQMLAQNWDWRTSVGHNLAMVSIQRAGKPRIWMVTEPGIVGKIGFNSSSVGVCLNAIRARPTDDSLLPIHILLRVALESTSVDSAISRIEKLGGSASSQHVLVADVDGARGLELSPRGAVYLDANQDGLLVHTNHFLANRLVEEPPWLAGSPKRLSRAYELCQDIRRDHQVVDAGVLRERVFTDKEGAPQAICCIPDRTSGGLAAIQTLFNIVMTFEKGRDATAEIVFGRPGSEQQSQIFVIPW